MARRRFDITSILVVLVAAFLLLDGILSFQGSTAGMSGLAHKISRSFGGEGNTVSIILAVAQISAGALLLLSRIVSIGTLDSILRVGLFLFWLAVMVMSLVLGGNIDRVTTLLWWKDLVWYTIILAILWKIKE
ncbi:MAG: hypothetical protein MI717_03840 [Spirochaetales bacterium]|nr:hypothetical protein [Spirochaetales bacterium]